MTAVQHEMGPRFQRAWDLAWTLPFLKKNQDGTAVALVRVELEEAPPMVVMTNGHFMGEFTYVSRCVPKLDNVVLKAYSDGEFPVSLSIPDQDFTRMVSGVKQYFTEFANRAIPIDDTRVLVQLMEEDDDITPVAVMRYRLGTSTGLDLPRYIALDPIYHYALRRHAHHFSYNKDWSTVFYYEKEDSKFPSAFLATMTPRVLDRVQSQLDEMSMFLPEEGK